MSNILFVTDHLDIEYLLLVGEYPKHGERYAYFTDGKWKYTEIVYRNYFQSTFPQNMKRVKVLAIFPIPNHE